MGSSYFGEPSFGSGSSSSSSSSRRGKKGNSDKPRQPQRGLGVAQLEKIRLHGQIASASASASASYHPSLPSSYASTFNNDQDMMKVHTAYSSIPSSSSSSSPSYGFPSNIMMGFGEYERANLRDGDSSQYTTTARWDPSNGNILETHHFAHPSLTSYLQNPPLEGITQSTKSKRKHRSGSVGAISQNSEACESQELDLELRLSI